MSRTSLARRIMSRLKRDAMLTVGAPGVVLNPKRSRTYYPNVARKGRITMLRDHLAWASARG
jgi:hypothetical protein